MGMSDPRSMADGLAAVAAARARTLATLTIDSYTRVEDIAGARAALAAGRALNGFPLVNHGPQLTAEVVRAADGVPVQVRHGSARPGHIFEAMVAAELSASEGGPVSYCLPYSRLPLAEAVPAWTDATQQLAEAAAERGMRAHLETFGGCMLGQMCPPSLLVAISVLEAMFFARNGITSVSMSYAQQTNAVQDIEALAALHHLAELFLPTQVARHVVLYTYMGVYPATEAGAELLLDSSAQLAVRGGAQRLIVKTVAEAHRIPTVAENVAALERAARVSREALRDDCPCRGPARSTTRRSTPRRCGSSPPSWSTAPTSVRACAPPSRPARSTCPSACTATTPARHGVRSVTTGGSSGRTPVPCPCPHPAARTTPSPPAGC